MPGRKPAEAYRAFVAPLANALSCVGHASILCGPGGQNKLGQVHSLYIGSGSDGTDFLRLSAQPGAIKLMMNARMQYEIIEDNKPDFGPYRVSTRCYMYSVQRQDGTEIIDWHWHPDSRSDETRPHVHLGSRELSSGGVLNNKMHLLTGRVTFENVIRQLISEFRVKPIKPSWREVLDACEKPHLAYRTWG